MLFNPHSLGKSYGFISFVRRFACKWISWKRQEFELGFLIFSFRNTIPYITRTSILGEERLCCFLFSFFLFTVIYSQICDVFFFFSTQKNAKRRIDSSCLEKNNLSVWISKSQSNYFFRWVVEKPLIFIYLFIFYWFCFFTISGLWLAVDCRERFYILLGPVCYI